MLSQVDPRPRAEVTGMSEPKLPDVATLKQVLREAIESGKLAQQLEQLKTSTQMGRERLQEVEASLGSLRNLLDTVRQDLSGQSTVELSTADLLAEVLRQPAFAQLAAELLARLLAEQKGTPGPGHRGSSPTS